MIYYISDSHFGDERVMRLAKRPFHSVNDMDDTMISLWNKKVGGTDVVYVVGDFAINNQTAIKTLKQLNGQKYLFWAIMMPVLVSRRYSTLSPRQQSVRLRTAYIV